MKQTKKRVTHLFYLLHIDTDFIGGPGCESRQKKHLRQLLQWTNNTVEEIKLPITVLAYSIELALSGSVALLKSEKQIICDEISGLDEKISSIDKLELPFDHSLHYKLEELINDFSSKNDMKSFISILRQV